MSCAYASCVFINRNVKSDTGSTKTQITVGGFKFERSGQILYTVGNISTWTIVAHDIDTMQNHCRYDENSNWAARGNVVIFPYQKQKDEQEDFYNDNG